MIPPGVREIHSGAFAVCTKLTSVTFPAGLTSIGDSAFVACGKLAEARFPASLRFIGQESFSRTALKSVEIPDKATVKADAFPPKCKIIRK